MNADHATATAPQHLGRLWRAAREVAAAPTPQVGLHSILAAVRKSLGACGWRSWR